MLYDWTVKKIFIIFKLVLNLNNSYIILCLNRTYLPTKFSSTELLPADCPPTTAICGRSSCIWTPNCVKASWSLFTIGINCSIPKLPDMAAGFLQHPSLYGSPSFVVQFYVGPYLLIFFHQYNTNLNCASVSKLWHLLE